jgi:hypothetical protein
VLGTIGLLINQSDCTAFCQKFLTKKRINNNKKKVKGHSNPITFF